MKLHDEKLKPQLKEGSTCRRCAREISRRSHKHSLEAPCHRLRGPVLPPKLPRRLCKLRHVKRSDLNQAAQVGDERDKSLASRSLDQMIPGTMSLRTLKVQPPMIQRPPLLHEAPRTGFDLTQNSQPEAPQPLPTSLLMDLR